jgi:hypothetical protein
MTRLRVKVVPGAAKPGIAGWLGDHLKVRVAAPAEKGKANAAVVAMIADVLGVALGGVRVVSGHGSPRKVLEVDGLTGAEIRERIVAGGIQQAQQTQQQ